MDEFYQGSEIKVDNTKSQLRKEKCKIDQFSKTRANLYFVNHKY